jgi:hypothetical protein
MRPVEEPMPRFPACMLPWSPGIHTAGDQPDQWTFSPHPPLIHHSWTLLNSWTPQITHEMCVLGCRQMTVEAITRPGDVSPSLNDTREPMSRGSIENLKCARIQIYSHARIRKRIWINIKNKYFSN